MKRICSVLCLLLFVILCIASYIQAASEPRYVGGAFVQGAAPSPDETFKATVSSDVGGYFGLSDKLWWEFWSPKDCKGWILSSQSRAGKRSFTIPAYERTSYVVNPGTTFFGYSSCTGMEIKSQ